MVPRSARFSDPARTTAAGSQSPQPCALTLGPCSWQPEVDTGRKAHSHAARALCCRESEKAAYAGQEFQDPIKKLFAAASYFDFLGDFPVIVIPKYPQYFCALDPQRSYRPLELVEWDESLAITKLEKKAKLMALEKSLGEIETKGKPLPFKLKYSARMQIKKKVLHIYPYQEVDWVKEDPVLVEQKEAALLHEKK
ncbi:hypothetical protein L7F22_003697 [Adiantum nelumboides]|nr:hypothetical protein [Adiantum nelumboides]